MSKKKIDRIWAISLMVISVLSLINAIISLVGFEMPHLARMVIAVFQIVLGIEIIIVTVL